LENQYMGMEGLPSKALQHLARRWRQPRRLGLEPGRVGLVAEQRMADVGQMDADLVGAAGLEPARDQAGDRRAVGAGIALQHLEMGHGGAAVRPDSDLVAGLAVAAK